MYLVYLLRNGVIIILSVCDSNLHTPMYFFLSNLSFLDILYTSSSISQQLLNFKDNHSLLWIWSAYVSLLCYGNHMCPSKHDGICPLHGHLLPSEIPHHYEQGFLCTHGCWILNCRGCQFCVANFSCHAAFFLWG